MNIGLKDIKKQYAFAKKEGWMGWFEKAADLAGTSTAHFLAIASRETNIKNIKGDFRNGKFHGFGVMQVDIGTDAKFAEQWSEENAEPAIRRGGEIYQSKVNQIKNGQGKTLTVKSLKRFVGKEAEPDDVRRIATAAYNCGLWAYFHFSQAEHVDSTTTGKDYSRDVYDRAIEFAKLRVVDGHEGALEMEVFMQGKYAREEHKRLIGNSQLKEEPKIVSPPSLEKPAPVADEAKVVIQAEVPKETNPKEKAEVSGPKSWIAAVTTFMASAGAGVFSWAKGASTEIVVAFFASAALVGVVYVVARYWYRNKENQRLADVQLAREKMAQEITLMKMKSAMQQESNTVEVAH